METHEVNRAVDIFEDLPDGRQSKLPMARIIFFGYDYRFKEESLFLMRMLGRNPVPADAEALKGSLEAIWMDRAHIDQAVVLQLIDFADPFQARWFGGPTNQPWIIPRPENGTVQQLRLWTTKLQFITDRICAVTNLPKESILSQQRYRNGEYPEKFRLLFNIRIKGEIKDRYMKIRKELELSSPDVSPVSSPYKAFSHATK
jgi:hypothetical protein